MHKLEDLKIWKKAMEFAEETHRLTASFPAEEKYGLISQLRRSAVSVPSNIAEGAGRNTKGEFRNFLSIANGSSYELLTQLILSQGLNLIPEKEVTLVISQLIEVQKMNYSLIKSLEK